MARISPLHDNPRSKRMVETREAKKGDVERKDSVIQDGADTIEFKGDYESQGYENQPEGSSNHISDKARKEMNEENEKWRKGGKKGPAPAFKGVPKDGTQEYEIWRLRKKDEVPTS